MRPPLTYSLTYQVGSEEAHLEERARQLAAGEIHVHVRESRGSATPRSVTPSGTRSLQLDAPPGARAKAENIKERARLLAAEHVSLLVSASPRPLRRGGTPQGCRSSRI